MGLPGYSTARTITFVNNGMPKRNHFLPLVGVSCTTANANLQDVVCTTYVPSNPSLSDKILGSDPLARGGQYAPLVNTGTKTLTLGATWPAIPAGTSYGKIQYGNPSAPNYWNQSNTYKSKYPLAVSVLVDSNNVTSSVPYGQANTQLQETNDGRLVGLWSATTDNSGANAQVWQLESTNYLANDVTSGTPPTYARTNIYTPTSGNAIGVIGDLGILANGDMLCVIGSDTNANFTGNLGKLYMVRRAAGGTSWSSLAGANPLPNFQQSGGRQLCFGPPIQQANGDIWQWMNGCETGNVDANEEFSIWAIKCPNGSDPTNGNNWVLLGGSMSTARVFKGGTWTLPGTVDTNGTTLTGHSTFFLDQLQAGCQVIISGTKYIVASVSTQTSATLTASAGVQTGQAYALYAGWTEHGVDMDSNGNIAMSAWNVETTNGVLRGSAYSMISTSRDGSGNPIWTGPFFIRPPGGNPTSNNETNQTYLKLDRYGTLYFTYTRGGQDVWMYTSNDWYTAAAAGKPTWNAPRAYSFSGSGGQSGTGDTGNSAISIIKNGVNADMVWVTWYYGVGGTITNTSGNGVSPISIASANHGIQTGDSVTITGVGGNTAANQTNVTATRIDANTFSIPGTGNGNYTSGGTWASGNSNQRNIGLFTSDSLYNTLAYQFLENWAAGNFSNWGSSSGCTISQDQLLNGMANTCKFVNGVLKHTDWGGSVPTQTPQTAWAAFVYVTLGNPAFAGASTGGAENYVWGATASNPRTIEYYNGSTNTNTFSGGGTLPLNQWVPIRFYMDANGKILAFMVNGTFLGTGSYSNSNGGSVIYFDFLTSATYYISDIALVAWTDQDVTITIGPEVTQSSGIDRGVATGGGMGALKIGIMTGGIMKREGCAWRRPARRRLWKRSRLRRRAGRLFTVSMAARSRSRHARQLIATPPARKRRAKEKCWRSQTSPTSPMKCASG